MADVTKLLQAAIQAIHAEAFDLAADFTERALAELRTEHGLATELPWSTDRRDDERFREFVSRATAFLGRFADAGEAGVLEEEARELAREHFSEQPRVVGPSFYRTGALQADRSGPVTRVRLTKSGEKQLAAAKKALAELEKKAAVY